MSSTPQSRKRRSSVTFADSSPFDSPSKQLLNEHRRRKGVRKSLDSAQDHDSPARQLQLELQRQLYESDVRFVQQLNDAARDSERQQVEALKLAQQNHERVRKSAEAVQERIRLEYEAARQAEIERVQAEIAQQELEQKRRQVEEQKRQEAARQQQIREQREIAEEEERIRNQRQQFEAEEARRKADLERKAQEEQKAREQEAAKREAEAKAKEAEAAAAATASQPAPAASSGPSLHHPTANGIASSQDQSKEATHNRYLEIHQSLKKMRKDAIKTLKQQPALKTALGDMRRSLRTICSQYSLVRENNIQRNKDLAKVLQKSSAFTDPMVDVRGYMESPPAGGSDADYQIPLCLLYFLNLFTKYIIGMFISNGSTPKNNSTIGASVVYIFGDPQFMLGGSVPLIDIFLAKVHKVCPVLFGITADETTKAGRNRLGWGRTEPGGPFVDLQTQGDRNIGLGTGWASVTLRDLHAAALKNGRKNPLPPRMFWASAASILNTPPAQLTKCHLEVLRSMLEFSVDRFILFYGHAAIAVLRRAAIDLPKMVQESTASHALGMLGDILNRESNITL